MYPAATRDPAIGAPTTAAPGTLMRWTLPVTPTMGDQLYACVSSAYEEWGAAPYQADHLGDLAVEFAGYVELEAAPAFVAVTVTLEGGRATVCAAPAAEPAPDHMAELRLYEEPVDESGGGSRQHAGGRLYYAHVNLGVRGPTTPRRRAVTHHYLTTDPDAPDRAAFNTGLSLSSWGVPLPRIAELAETARALVAAAATEHPGEVAVVSVLDGLQASVHVAPLSCTAHHPSALVDPVTAAAVREAAGTGAEDGCPCLALALPAPQLRGTDLDREHPVLA
ncbi:hypothetical protein [Streptomyces sp. NPDC001492]